MRLLMLLVALVVTAPAYGQRIFRASAIDQEQNNRLDALEARIAAVESAPVVRESKPVRQQVAVATPVRVESPVIQPPVVVRPAPARAMVSSGRYSTAELRAMIHAKRPGGWRGPQYADVSPRSAAKQHLVGPEHGFSWDQVAGLTQEEALILHDLAPRHGNQIFPSGRRNVQAQPVPQVRVASYAPPMPMPQPMQQMPANPWPADSGCANGQCPISSPTSQSVAPVRGGFFQRIFR